MLWDAATDLRNINSWFSWASYIKEIDKSALGRGKRLQVGYRILPIMGDYTFIATVKEFKRGRSERQTKVWALEIWNILGWLFWREIICWGQHCEPSSPPARGTCPVSASLWSFTGGPLSSSSSSGSSWGSLPSSSSARVYWSSSSSLITLAEQGMILEIARSLI